MTARRAVLVALASTALRRHACWSPVQMGKKLFKTHTKELDLSEYPFQPARQGKLTLEFLDPFAMALAMAFNPKVAGTCSFGCSARRPVVTCR